MRPRGGIDIRNTFHNFQNGFTVRADATEVPVPKKRSSSSNSYPLQGGKVDPNFEKNSEKNFRPPLRAEKYAESIGEIRFQIRSQLREIFAIL